MVLIEADVGNVALDLHDIDPHLKLRYSEAGEYFVVYFERMVDRDTPKQDVVLTAQDCDQRIVARVRQIASPEYDYVKDMERLDREADKRKRDEFRERIGEGAERLHFELRKAQGVRSKAFIPAMTFEAPFIG